MPPSTSVPYLGTWHVQNSSRRRWCEKRNILASFKASHSMDYSYHENESSEVKTHTEVDYNVIAAGKDGNLESWMTETEAGIVDEAGEIRADWRSRWLVIVFQNSDGIDILCNRQERISDGTMKHIIAVLESNNNLSVKLEVPSLFVVTNDGARDEEMKRAKEEMYRKWQRRTGKDEGISEDLVYDDVEKKKVSKCVIQ